MRFQIMLLLVLVTFLQLGEIRGNFLPLPTCLTDFNQATGASNPDTGLKIDQIVLKYGYPVQLVNVTTDDGYILSVYRIPSSPKSPVVEGVTKKAVYINHGLQTNGLQWLIQYKDGNLAMMLADAGYDVFIGNSRGNSYSQGHVSKTTSDTSYWDFSFHEMGKFDVPAVINAILALTGNQKLYYIGHSMGCAQFVVAMSENPELNSKIHTAFLLAPAVFISHSTNAYRLLSPLAYNAQYLLNPVFNGKLEVAGVPLPALCAPSAIACGACENVIFAVYGYDGPQTNATTLSVFLGAFPDTASTKTVVHMAQNMASGDFKQFDYLTDEENIEHYGTPVPPSYNVKAVTCPTVIYYGDNDNLVVPQDARILRDAMNPTALKGFVRPPWTLFTHMDFGMAINATDWVYKPIQAVMDAELYE